MIDFSNESYENIRARMLQNLDADVDKRETSIADLSIAAEAYELATIYEILTKIQNNSWILTAEGIYLDYKCLERGVIRKPATKAIKKASFNIAITKDTEFSTIGLEEPMIYKTTEDAVEETSHLYDRLTYISGLESARINFGFYYSTDINKWYKDGIVIVVEEVATLPTPSSATTGKYYLTTNDLTLYNGVTRTLFVADAECQTEGTIGNTYVGNVMPLVNNNNLTYAYIGEIVLAGSDVESDVSLRTRYLATLGSESFAGNIAAYRTYALSINGVGAVQVYPHWQGPGTVKLSILDTSYHPATQALIETVQNEICPPEDGTNEPSPLGYGIAPIGAKVTIGTATNIAVNVSLQVTLTQGTTIPDVQSRVERKIEEYLEIVREAWGNPLITNIIQYNVNVYNSRINRAVSELEDVILNVTNININGLGIGQDLICTETSTLQQLPVLGTVTITEA